jgi:malonyl-CoA decarboxylase
VNEIAAPGLFDRAIRRITTVWRDMAAGVSRDEDESIEAQMQACLASRGGEVSARNRAAKLAQTYLSQDEAGRAAFLRTLAGFDSDPDAVAAAYAKVQAAADPAERATAKAALRRALEPPRLKLLTQFTSIPDGRKFLVDLRGSLLKLRGSYSAGRRSARAARSLVRHRFSGAAADRLEQPRGAARKAGGL